MHNTIPRHRAQVIKIKPTFVLGNTIKYTSNGRFWERLWCFLCFDSAKMGKLLLVYRLLFREANVALFFFIVTFYNKNKTAFHTRCLCVGKFIVRNVCLHVIGYYYPLNANQSSLKNQDLLSPNYIYFCAGK